MPLEYEPASERLAHTRQKFRSSGSFSLGLNDRFPLQKLKNLQILQLLKSVQDVRGQAVGGGGPLSHRMYQFNGVSKSTPPNNRSIFFNYYELKQKLTIL